MFGFIIRRARHDAGPRHPMAALPVSVQFIPTTMSASPKISLSAVQKHRKRRIWICGTIGIVLFSVLASASPSDSWRHETIEAVGLALIVLCILGRSWCTLYAGGRKKSVLLTVGPYSVVRNPLYVFSLCGAAGIGLTSGSALIGAAVAFSIFLIFNAVVRSEETFLATAFGADYDRYIHSVPRWIPKFSIWRDQAEMLVSPRLVLITFRDACIFLVAVPAFEAIERLQASGILPVFLRLP